jgi:hypothetical protein
MQAASLETTHLEWEQDNSTGFNIIRCAYLSHTHSSVTETKASLRLHTYNSKTVFWTHNTKPFTTKAVGIQPLNCSETLLLFHQDVHKKYTKLTAMVLNVRTQNIPNAIGKMC